MKLKIVNLNDGDGWREDILKRAKGRILGKYAFCPDEVTHCCEITPSYELHFIEYFPENPEADGDEENMEEIEEGANLTMSESPIIYVHCHTIDALPEIDYLDRKVGVYSLTGKHWVSYEWESWEEFEEYICGNSV